MPVLPRFVPAAALAVTALMGATAASAATVVTLEAPGVQSANLAGMGATGGAVETFDGFSLGTLADPTTSTLGSYSPGLIREADVYGGADDSQYLFSFTGGTTLTLSSSATYFGMWWSAGSVSNQVELKSGGTTVFSLDTSDIINFVSAAPNGGDYFGSPTSISGNNGQPYAFVNIFADQAFDSIVLSGPNFESDNHTIATSFATTTGTNINPVPVPAALPLLAGALVGAGVMSRRRRR